MIGLSKADMRKVRRSAKVWMSYSTGSAIHEFYTGTWWAWVEGQTWKGTRLCYR